MFALGSLYVQEEERAEHMQVAKDITSTCYKSYQATPTRLGPETFAVRGEGKIEQGTETDYKLRPEVCLGRWGGVWISGNSGVRSLFLYVPCVCLCSVGCVCGGEGDKRGQSDKDIR